MNWQLALLLCLSSLACGYPRSRSEVARPMGGMVRVLVLDDGYHPNNIVVHANQEVTFAFQLRARRPCLRKIVVYLDDQHKLTKSLRLGEDTEVRTRFAHTGQTGFSCGMAMFGATIDVEP